VLGGVIKEPLAIAEAGILTGWTNSRRLTNVSKHRSVSLFLYLKRTAKKYESVTSKHYTAAA